MERPWTLTGRDEELRRHHMIDGDHIAKAAVHDAAGAFEVFEVIAPARDRRGAVPPREEFAGSHRTPPEGGPQRPRERLRDPRAPHRRGTIRAKNMSLGPSFACGAAMVKTAANPCLPMAARPWYSPRRPLGAVRRSNDPATWVCRQVRAG